MDEGPKDSGEYVGIISMSDVLSTTLGMQSEGKKQINLGEKALKSGKLISEKVGRKGKEDGQFTRNTECRNVSRRLRSLALISALSIMLERSKQMARNCDMHEVPPPSQSAPSYCLLHPQQARLHSQQAKFHPYQANEPPKRLPKAQEHEGKESQFPSPSPSHFCWRSCVGEWGGTTGAWGDC